MPGTEGGTLMLRTCTPFRDRVTSIEGTGLAGVLGSHGPEVPPKVGVVAALGHLKSSGAPSLVPKRGIPERGMKYHRPEGPDEPSYPPQKTCHYPGCPMERGCHCTMV